MVQVIYNAQLKQSNIVTTTTQCCDLSCFHLIVAVGHIGEDYGSQVGWSSYNLALKFASAIAMNGVKTALFAIGYTHKHKPKNEIKGHQKCCQK